jgi:glycosyltransferase involved in cell wall biosynthesis
MDDTIEASFLLCTNVFNDEFKATVDSCLEQTIYDIEIIIIVNGVDDKIKWLVGKYCNIDKRIRVIQSNAMYLSFNLNIGLFYCRSNLVARIDVGDIALPERIQVQRDFMLKNVDVAVCGSAYKTIKNKKIGLKNYVMPIYHNQIQRRLYFSNPISHPSTMLRRDVVFSVGGYMGGRYAQDYDLWIRIMTETKYKLHNLERVLIYYEEMGGSARRSTYSYTSASSTQWRMFVLYFNPIWAISASISLLKRIFSGLENKLK